MKTRIVFVTNAKSANGGTERHLTDLILRMDLSNSNIDAVVLCYGIDAYTQSLKGTRNINVHIVGGLKANNLLAFSLSFRKYRPEVIAFVNGNLGLFGGSAYVAAMIAGAKRIVAIEHSPPLALLDTVALPGSGYLEDKGLAERLYYRVRYNRIVRRVLRTGWNVKQRVSVLIPRVVCDKTICVSNAGRERLVQHYLYPADRTITIPNGVDPTHYGRGKEQLYGIREKLGIGIGENVIVCVSRLVGLKSVDILLSAMSIVCKERASCRCLIVGGGPLENQLRALSRDLGLESSVVFVGHAEDVRPYLELGNVFVLPSQWEGMPLSVLEAMAYGLPCVVTDVGGNRELIVPGEHGFVVTPGSAVELAKAITYLLTHKDERERMGHNARRRVETCFDIEDTVAGIKAALLN